MIKIIDTLLKNNSHSTPKIERECELFLEFETEGYLLKI